MGPTKHPCAFRLNKKEIAEIVDVVAKTEATALEEGMPAEDAKTLGEAKKRELTKLKQEERWQRSMERQAAGLGKAEADDDNGCEPPYPEEPPSPVAAVRTGGGTQAEPRKSSGGVAASTNTNHNYYVQLGDALNLILKHRVFQWICDAEPIEISGDTAVSSGVQAHNPHPTV